MFTIAERIVAKGVLGDRDGQENKDVKAQADFYRLL